MLKYLEKFRFSVTNQTKGIYLRVPESETRLLHAALPSGFPIQRFRTQEPEPANHDFTHVGRFYTIPQADCKVLFETVTNPIPETFRDQCHTFREVSLLVRPPFIDIKKCIEAYPSSLPTLRYLIYGSSGTGKTSTLLHVLHYAYTKGYLIVNVTWAPLWARFVKEYQPSTTRPGYFDHTTNAVLWLSHFRSQNSVLLKKLELKTLQTYNWNQRENTMAGSDFVDLIEHGIARPVHASECVYAIIQELKLHSTQGRCKAMVLIDGVNAFYYKSLKMKDDRRNIISPDKVTLFEAFRQFFKSDWSGGVVLGVVDGMAIHSDYRTSDMPRHLLGKQGWEDFDPFVPIQVEKYSQLEIQTTIDYYLDRKWLAHKDAGTDQARKELEVLSCSNPYVLMQLCASR